MGRQKHSAVSKTVLGIVKVEEALEFFDLARLVTLYGFGRLVFEGELYLAARNALVNSALKSLLANGQIIVEDGKFRLRKPQPTRSNLDANYLFRTGEEVVHNELSQKIRKEIGEKLAARLGQSRAPDRVSPFSLSPTGELEWIPKSSQVRATPKRTNPTSPATSWEDLEKWFSI